MERHKVNNYMIKFDNHYNALLNALTKFRESRKLQDVCFLVGSEKMYVNRTILAAFSPYVEQVLNEMNNDSTVVFIAHGISANTIQQLINFMYQGVVHIPEEDIVPFLQAGKIYQITGLKDHVLPPNKETHHNQPKCNCGTQPPMDSVLPNAPPPYITASQLFPPYSSQQASAASIGKSHEWSSPFATSTSVTITSSPPTPTVTLPSKSGITITPDPVTTASQTGVPCECITRGQRPRVTATWKPSPGSPESNSDVEILGDPRDEVVSVGSSPSPDRSPLQSGSKAERTASDVTQTGSTAPVTITLSKSSACSSVQPSSSSMARPVPSKRVRKERASAPVGATRSSKERAPAPVGATRSSKERSGSPAEKRMRLVFPAAPSATSLGRHSVPPPAQPPARLPSPPLLPPRPTLPLASSLAGPVAPDSREKLAPHLVDLSSSFFQDGEDIIREVLAYPESLPPDLPPDLPLDLHAAADADASAAASSAAPSAASSSAPAAASSAAASAATSAADEGDFFSITDGGQRGGVARRGHSFRPIDAHSEPLPSEEEGSGPPHDDLPAEAGPGLRGGCRGRGRGRGHGRSRGRRSRRHDLPFRSTKPEERKNLQSCSMWCKY